MRHTAYWNPARMPKVSRLILVVATEDTSRSNALFVVHDTNPRALGRNVRGFTQAEHWFQDLTTLS